MKEVDVLRMYSKTVLFTGMVLCLILSTSSPALSSIQLTGNFNGITCEPDDPANDMTDLGDHEFIKLKFINEPGDPDTIFFKFTKDNSYMPEHWGWSFSEGWGIADLDWSPPSIAAVLPDSGFYYFHFNDTTYAYSLSRPDAAIEGIVHSNLPTGVPAGTKVSLFDQEYGLIGMYEEFTDSSFSFSPLPEATFYLVAAAPGYRDTTITDIQTYQGNVEYIDITLEPLTSVMISSAFTENIDGGVMLIWSTSCCDAKTGFDIYRGTTPDLLAMERRNIDPIRSSIPEFRFFDSCEDTDIDHYYYIVELNVDDPTRYGPVLAPASMARMTSSLGQNYPNPFNPATTIPYYVSTNDQNARIMIAFYDVAGRVVDRYDIGTRPAGSHSFDWNPSLSHGRNIPSGVYYCRLTVGKDVFTRKMIMLR